MCPLSQHPPAAWEPLRVRPARRGASVPRMAWLGWREATQAALYGPDGFFRRPEGPAGHFRTSVHASPLFAGALLRLARAAGTDTVIDVGAGRGELLRTLHHLDPSLTLHGVDLADRPPRLPSAVSWSAQLPADTIGLLVANEWLDNVPLDVVEQSTDGPRLVEVDPATGTERLAGAPEPDDISWLDRWWPLDEPGDRAEIGRPRDAAWAAAIGSLRCGLAVAIDYTHELGARPAYGTLCGYRDGRAVPAVPDGSCDITAHVALDACAAAGQEAGAAATLRATQRDALRALGVRGARPSLELAQTAPMAYLQKLQHAGEEAELLDPGGLGGFGWLVQCVGVPLPLAFEACSSR
jgi:SAM-dependent MidA family methyltransferase